MSFYANYERYSKKAGYPALYLKAWELLASGEHQAAIDHVFDFFDLSNETLQENSKISFWHLKAVLYAWLDNTTDNAVLTTLKERVVFINMTPQEAESRLYAAQKYDNMIKPYLFRISTTLPGVITLSYITPYSNKILHKRLKNIDHVNQLKEEKNFYHTLIKQSVDVVVGNKLLYNIDDIKKVVNTIDPSAPLDLLKDSLWSPEYMKHKELELNSIIRLLLNLYVKKATTLRLYPKETNEVLGITKSYITSYDFSVAISCSFCYKDTVTIKEPINNAFYCNDECYRQDYEKFY
jgi:hypothetical protein